MTFQCVKCFDEYLTIPGDGEPVVVAGICPACTRTALGFNYRPGSQIAAELDLVIEKIDRQRAALNRPEAARNPSSARAGVR